jgi:ribosomal protein L10
VALAKTLTTFAKTSPALMIKAAVVQGQAIQAAEVVDLASCRARRSCTRACCSCSRARWCSLVRVLNAVPRDLLSVLVGRRRRRSPKETLPDHGGTEWPK